MIGAMPLASQLPCLLRSSDAASEFHSIACAVKVELPFEARESAMFSMTL